MCYVYSSLIQHRECFGPRLLQLHLRENWTSVSLLFTVSVKDDAHGLSRETQTQLTPPQPDHAAVLNLLETAVSTSF